MVIFVADTVDIGRIPDFQLTDKQLEDKIKQYKDMTDSGEIMLPSWPDFCTFLGVGGETLEAVMDRGFDTKGAYYDRAVALKKMGEWCEAQLVSNPNWGGKMAVKAMFILKQGLGRSRRYMDERSTTVTASDPVKITFGGADPRAKRAGK